MQYNVRAETWISYMDIIIMIILYENKKNNG